MWNLRQTDFSNSRILKISVIMIFLLKMLLSSQSKKKGQWALLAYSLRKFGQTPCSSAIQSLERLYFLFWMPCSCNLFEGFIQKGMFSSSLGFYRLKYFMAGGSQSNKRIEKINACYTDWSLRKKKSIFFSPYIF